MKSQLRIFILKSPIRIISFFSWERFSRSGPMHSFANSVTGTFRCLYAPNNFVFLITQKVDPISFFLYSFRSFCVLHLNFLSVYNKVPPFEDVASRASHRYNLEGQYLIKWFYLFLVYTQCSNFSYFRLVLTIFYQILHIIKSDKRKWRNVHMEIQIGSWWNST